MLIALVFTLLVASIAATVWFALTGQLDRDPDDDCDSSRNVICLYCYGLIELNCGCPIMPLARAHRWCNCIEPQRSDEYLGIG